MRPIGTPRLVCHVLLVETANGLALVDTGYGLLDIADPRRRLGPFRHVFKPAYDPDETAVRQVERLGFQRDDVRHIVVTHFDLDHIGGLADFPASQVHVTAAEVRGTITSPSWRERVRYQSVQWSHHPQIVEHTAGEDNWRGFAGKALDEIAPGMVLIPLPGHSRGHACVAVDAGDRWILHCGDAVYHRGSLDGRTRVPAGLRAQEWITAFDRELLRANQARLAELYQRSDPDLLMICAHDTALYERALNRQ
jgi:glyoxylase-like metal-dependent hydrolase (beta-lactamase superfamily II)